MDGRLLIDGKLGPFYFEKPKIVDYFSTANQNSKSINSSTTSKSFLGSTNDSISTISKQAIQSSIFIPSTLKILKILPLSDKIYILASNYKLYEICCQSSYNPMKIETLNKNDFTELILIERDDIANVKDIFGNDSIQIAITQDEKHLVIWGEWQYMSIPNLKPTEHSLSRISPSMTKKDFIRHIDITELLFNEEDETPEDRNSFLLQEISASGYYTAFLTKNGELYVNGLGIAWLSLTSLHLPRKVNLISVTEPSRTLKVKSIACCDKFILILVDSGELYVWGQVDTQHYSQPTLILFSQLPTGTLTQIATSRNNNESPDENENSDVTITKIASSSSYAVIVTSSNDIFGIGKCPNFFKNISKKSVYPSSLLKKLESVSLTNCISIGCSRQAINFIDCIGLDHDSNINSKATGQLLHSLHPIQSGQTGHSDLSSIFPYTLKSNSNSDLTLRIKPIESEKQISISDALSRIQDMQSQLKLKEQIIKNQNQMIQELQQHKIDTPRAYIDYTFDDLSNQDIDSNSDYSYNDIKDTS